MRKPNKGGFTIVEIILFLAIAGLLLIAAMTSIGTRTRDVQFTDGMREIETFMQRQYSNVINGAIDAQQDCVWNGSGYTLGSTPSDGSCIFIGVIFEFNDPGVGFGDPGRGTITTHQVIGHRLETADLLACQASGDFAAYCVTPALSGLSSTFEASWGVEMYAGGNTAGGAGLRDSTAFGFIRMPDSTNIIPIVFADGSFDGNTLDPDLFRKGDPGFRSFVDGGPRLSAVDDETDAFYCFENATRELFASVSLAADVQGSGITLAFKPAEKYNINCDNSAYDANK